MWPVSIPIGVLVCVLASCEQSGMSALSLPVTAQPPRSMVTPTSIRPSMPTHTPTPMTIPSPEHTINPALVLASAGVRGNSDWVPYSQTFDGVEMALVPVGCFEMGSMGVYSNEAPVHEQCFDAPFWIDVYEVSNEQYGSSGYFQGDNLPRELVSWFDAAAFCKGRGMRLPTEAEWEYASRGPDGLLYPWGGRFLENGVVYRGNSDGHTRGIDTGAGNQSWVGAFDMSGNVGEWVSSLYRVYPYDAMDGREVGGDIDGTNARVIRGGSWWTVYPLDLRAATRYGSIPTNVSNHVGFRCARSHDGG
ncbi:MAG: SUMF1/EgtB/PvdO family nonheme iron enzyme [Anaerolineae bacterium]|nr:SUMF1/EgtB/PvdO family nonheme iron enzyme [Anaerolineae bacterium]